jgi:menaquinone-9 beta-reductase
MRRTDPLIIGGGPAGSAAAIVLARGGAKPLLLEANRETGDAICGGFISWRTLQSIEALGVTAAELGGQAVSRVRLLAGRDSAEAALPSGAIGISRHRLDSLLLKRAVEAGAAVERGVSVKSLEAHNQIALKDGTHLEADSLFIATGKHDLRGLGRDRIAAPTLGLRCRLAPHPGLTHMISDAIELHLFDGGYAGLILQEDGSANLCMAVRKDRLAEAGGEPLRLLTALGTESPALGERLAFLDAAPQVDAIAAVPYGWIAKETAEGQFRLGDQAACIPSLAGEGNGLALASGMRAAAAWLAGGAATAISYQKQFAQSVSRPVKAASVLWHLAENPRTAPTLIHVTRIAPFLAGAAARFTRIGH